MKAIPQKAKPHIIAVSMGYGHQRTAYPLKNFAFESRVINANDYPGIPEKDKKIWRRAEKFYEAISRFKRVPLIGEIAFSIFNKLQEIPSFFPRRDLSKPDTSLKITFSLIKRGCGRHLIEKLKKNSMNTSQNPDLVSTFFVPAFMAEIFDYPGEIFCIVCDADIARVWAGMAPGLSRIKYLVPTVRAKERLRLYGVKPRNVFLTGYPLPRENIGTEKLEVLKHDLAHRLVNLDPKSRYYRHYGLLVEKYIGKLPKKSDHLLSLMFAVGGAGAQKEIGIRILKGLSSKIRQGKIKLVLAAGTNEKIKDYFVYHSKNLSAGVEIIFGKDIEDYFQKFNHALRKTDILWTKPSELSFYTALGLPIIVAPCIGSHEFFNKEWLLQIGSAMPQKNPYWTDQWLFDLLDKGWLAEAAMQGFVEAEKLGAFNIEKIIFSKKVL